MKYIKRLLIYFLMSFSVLHAGITVPKAVGITFGASDFIPYTSNEVDYYKLQTTSIPLSIDFYGDINIKTAETPLISLFQDILSHFNYRLSYNIDYIKTEGFFTKHNTFDSGSPILDHYIETSLLINLYNYKGYFLDFAYTYHLLLNSDFIDGVQIKSVNGISFENSTQSYDNIEIGIGKTIKSFTFRVFYVPTLMDRTLNVNKNGVQIGTYKLKQNYQINTSVIYWW